MAIKKQQKEKYTTETRELEKRLTGKCLEESKKEKRGGKTTEGSNHCWCRLE